MSQFETMFDNLGVQAEIMDQVMDNVNAGSYAEQDVSNLVNQVREENSMKVTAEFEQVGLGKGNLTKEQQKEQQKVGMQMNK